MATKSAKVGWLDVEIDVAPLRDQFSVKRFDAAIKVAIERSGATLMERIRRGFQVGGWNPKTGAPGYWPERKVPDHIQKAYEDHLAGGKHPNKFKLHTAKDAKGQIRRMRPKEKDLDDPTKYDRQMLVDTGRYMDAIALKMSNGTDGAQAVVGVDDAAVPYAKYQEYGVTQIATGPQAAFLRQLGFSIWKGAKIELPARRVFVMPDPWKKDLTEIISEQVMEELTNGSSDS